MSPSPNQLRLVLASGSPRRRELLERLGMTFEVLTADLDESPQREEDPTAYVARLAREKAAAVAALRPGALVLAADTSVILEGEILGKPSNRDHAAQMVGRLAGKAHQVLTGVALAGARNDLQVVKTIVHFRMLSPEETRWYAATGEGADKAGGYAIQGIGAAWVRAIEGSASNVIGLPLTETLEMLGRAGLPLPWNQP